ncbi:SAM-dependent methyltransferase [Luteipulveratus mongoliensis]|uniref:Cyclopropane-fatty-acyl-phospholipid synthase n=1 Tax=Luteipulveratus mongoliensis TaxID=571913 RepID=A0A0K1JL32_9MICO|nr:cyclopropane-fatty-acyl-phospholipid synthase family protein [Luteipulveratus mongoliensis]AKU17283.1 cyclopropane-fatty-acyl-phospholipid synthase [Luteipulveratus mongoliensis]
MTTLAPTIARPSVDPERWPDVARVPPRAKSAVAAAVTRSIFRRAVRRLPLRVDMPDGVRLGGAAMDPAAPTMQIHDPSRLMRRIGTSGLIGFGESYQAGEWDSDDLAGLIAAFASGIDALVPAPLKRMRSAYLARQPRADRPDPHNSRTNVERHYDLSNEMFAQFLDPTMSYSSALFERADEDMVTAQHRKIDRMLDQAGVRVGSRVLEIGTGWGELALRAAQRGARVDTITLSSEQHGWAEQKIAGAGLSDLVSVRLQDYREVRGEYDAVLSVEMVEAVGLDFLGTYFASIEGTLAPGGRAVIQAITMPHARVEETRDGYTWIHKYIFPGGALPSTRMLDDAAGEHGLRCVDDFAIGDSYAETLRRWANSFADATETLEALGFDEVFRRMWTFYLRYSEGGFRSGYLDVHQLTYTRENA